MLAALVNLPALVVGLFAGVLVDRWRRRRVLIATDLGRALLLALIPAAWLLDLTIFSVNQVSLSQAVTPERLQGRMNATMLVLVSGATPFAALLGGPLGELLGLRATLVLAALGELTAVLWIVLSSVARLRAHPKPEPRLVQD